VGRKKSLRSRGGGKGRGEVGLPLQGRRVYTCGGSNATPLGKRGRGGFLPSRRGVKRNLVPIRRDRGGNKEVLYLREESFILLVEREKKRSTILKEGGVEGMEKVDI